MTDFADLLVTPESEHAHAELRTRQQADTDRWANQWRTGKTTVRMREFARRIGKRMIAEAPARSEAKTRNAINHLRARIAQMQEEGTVS